MSGRRPCRPVSGERDGGVDGPRRRGARSSPGRWLPASCSLVAADVWFCSQAVASVGDAACVSGGGRGVPTAARRCRACWRPLRVWCCSTAEGASVGRVVGRWSWCRVRTVPLSGSHRARRPGRARPWRESAMSRDITETRRGGRLLAGGPLWSGLAGRRRVGVAGQEWHSFGRWRSAPLRRRRCRGTSVALERAGVRGGWGAAVPAQGCAWPVCRWVGCVTTGLDWWWAAGRRGSGDEGELFARPARIGWGGGVSPAGWLSGWVVSAVGVVTAVVGGCAVHAGAEWLGGVEGAVGSPP